MAKGKKGRRGIYKRGKVYWIRYAGLDGRMMFESSGSDRFEEAEAKLISRKNAVKEGKDPQPVKIGNHFFTELCEKYARWMKARHRSWESKAYRIDIIHTFFGNIPLRSFTTERVEEYQTHLMQKDFKPATVNKHISIVKAMIKKGVDWSMVAEDTLKRVREVKQLAENNGRLRYLSMEEIQGLLSHCKGHLAPVVLTALHTGMRKEEILSLKWENVDLRHGFIHLDTTKNDERREIPVSATLKAVMTELPSRFKGGYVFTNEGGKRFLDVKKGFHTALRNAGISDFRFHDLRHTFASHLVMSGVDLTTVSKLLGHKSLTMTLRYSHLAPDHLQNAVNILDQAFTGTRTVQKLYNEG